MIPISLTIEGFRSYSNRTTIDFSGLRRACIIGPNGSGKSTIVTAMLWSLFGKSNARNNSDLINSRASTATVEMLFAAGEKTYKITRSLKRAKGAASVELSLVEGDSPQIIAEGARETDIAVRKLLGLDYEDFISASVLVQGGSSRFSSMSPSERKAFMAKILGISQCEEISKLARSRTREIEAEKKAREEENERIASEMNPLAFAPQAFENAKIAFESAEKDFTELKFKIDGLRTKKTELDRLNLEHDSLSKSITRLEVEKNSLISEIASENDRSEALEAQISDKADITAQIDVFRGCEERLARLDTAFERITEAKAVISGAESYIAVWESSVSGGIAILETKGFALKGEIERIERELSREPELANRHKEFLAATAALAALNERRSEAEVFQTKIAEIKALIDAEGRSLTALKNEYIKKLEVIDKNIAGIDPIKVAREIRRVNNELARQDSVALELEQTRERWEAENARRASNEAEIAQLKRLREDSSSKRALIQSSEAGNCPLCGQSLEGRHREMVIADIDSALEAGIQRLSALEADKIEIAKNLLEIEVSGKELRNRAELFVAYNRRKIELEGFTKTLEELARERSETEARIGELSKTIADGDFLHDQRKSLALLEAQFEKAHVSATLYSATQDKIESLRESEFAFLRLPEAKSQKKALDSRWSELQCEIHRQNERLTSKTEVADKLEEIERANAFLSALEYNREEHIELKRKVAALAPLRERLHTIEIAEAAKAEIEKNLKGLLDRLEKAKSQLSELESRRTTLKGEIAGLSNFAEDLSVAEKAYETQSIIVKEAAIALLRAESDLDSLHSLESKHAEARLRLEELRERERIHRLLSTAMGKTGVPAFVISHSIPEIEREADDLLSLISGDELTLKLSADEEKDDLRIRIADSNGDRPYESYSGGESFRVDFALRLALSRFLAKRSGAQLSTLIIDEGFGTQDSEGLSLLVEALRSIEREFALILVVTHLESLKEEFDQIIEVTKKRSGSELQIFS